ncbi:MAG: hypothetical protein EKK48_08820 [Candidatus Melainabacteria bacterium]|nr:MAG: hypothetical protein EKK48_08820 [Candidatus Melainabacteria bacterium]
MTIDTDNITFDRAISLSNDLIYSVEKGEVTPAEAAEHLNSIVSSINGARGFFVALLTGESALSNDLPEQFLDAFRKHSDIVCDLLTKNLIMSATMMVTHRRNGDAQMEANSRSVNEKTKRIIRRLDNEAMARHLLSMTDAIKHKLQTGEDDHGSDYSPFLQRWRYDGEQLKEGLAALSDLNPD